MTKETTNQLYYKKMQSWKEEMREKPYPKNSSSHIVIMIYAYGGFIPSGFQKIEVYTLDRFTKRIIQQGKKDLLLQCIESLE